MDEFGKQKFETFHWNQNLQPWLFAVKIIGVWWWWWIKVRYCKDLFVVTCSDLSFHFTMCPHIHLYRVSSRALFLENKKSIWACLLSLSLIEVVEPTSYYNWMLYFVIEVFEPTSCYNSNLYLLQECPAMRSSHECPRFDHNFKTSWRRQLTGWWITTLLWLFSFTVIAGI